MKIRHLLIGMLAIAGAVACKPDQPVEEPVLEVNKTAVALAATAGESTFNVTANNAWTASADADWVSLDPASGGASDKAVTVKVTAEDNTATEARTATVTVKSGDLTRSVKVSQAAAQGETPGPGDDPTPGDVSWGMMGCFVDNLWSTDVPMTQEGEWIVAKGAQFTELTFKIRGNGSWDDATNIGVAPGAERGVVNGKVTVVTAEYAKANLGGDAADIRINGEAGTYDVYFNFENLEVYVMEQGYKPGEKEPQNPDPVEITYTVVGTLNNINWNNSAPEGLMTFDGQYHVAKNVPFVTAATLYGGADQIEFKIVETGSWTGYGRVEDVVNPINTEIAVKIGGDNIMVSGAEGNYDVYFDKENAKVWVLTPGATPGDAPEAPVTPVTEGVIWENDGTVGAAAWSGSPYRFSIEGGDSQNECVAEIPAAVWAGMKIAPFCVNIAPAEGAEWWQIRILDGWWSTNDESGANDITPQAAGLVDNGDGTYTFQVDLSANTALLEAMDTKHLLFAGDGFIINKIYFGEPETPSQPADVDIDGKQWQFTWQAFYGASAFIDLGVTVPGYAILAVDYGVAEPAYAGVYAPYIVAEYTITKTSANSGVITLAAEGKSIEIPYSNATETTVHFATAGFLYEDIDCTAATSKLEIVFEFPEPEYELEGKQWYYANMGVLVDLGLYEEGVMVVAVPLTDGSGFGAYMYGAYEVEMTDATSGKIIFTQYDPEWDEFMEPVEYPYSELSEELVMIGAEPLTGDPTPLPFVALDEPFEIQFDEIGGGADPVGPIENGQYWFFNGTKVMAPLAEGETTGMLPAGNVIDGASTEKNIFTFMYDPDMSYYTIMDSYGRFLGQTDETGNITVTDVLPTDDTYAYYLWCVEPGYGEAISIYNSAYYYDITYSSANNNWVLVDGGYEYPETLPILVKAENPVEEPVEPAGPKVVTVAEFNAATDNTIEYQVSGTISGIYQAYNASYDNISLYISDETGEMLAYRVSCAGINDPANTLTKGDLITVRGMRTLYNENPQMAQGGVIVEHTDVVVEDPTGGATLSFADKANRTVFTTSQQVWEQNGVKLINDKGSSTSNVADYAAPARFYKSSKLTVEYPGMTKIEFVCNNATYATALKDAGLTGTVTVSGAIVTVVLPAAADSYVVESLSGGQVRMDSLTVYAE